MFRESDVFAAVRSEKPMTIIEKTISFLAIVIFSHRIYLIFIKYARKAVACTYF